MPHLGPSLSGAVAHLELSAEAPVLTNDLDHVAVVIPTYNAARHWPQLQAALYLQRVPLSKVLIIDSSSSDETEELARESGFHFVHVPKEHFGHGATRQAACDVFPWADYLVFLTQDVVLESPDAIATLCLALEDREVGVAYGRQLARDGAGPIESHARLFNYPSRSQVKTFESRRVLGIKAAFSSDSFAVYRRTALESVGGFPTDVIVSEDLVVAARMLIAGWKVVYQAEAAAIHSHPFRMGEEFSRYFDIGANHSRQRWILETFGKADGEGLRFVRSELHYLWSNGGRRYIPEALARTISKWIGYRLGTMEGKLPRALNRRLSAYPRYW